MRIAPVGTGPATVALGLPAYDIAGADAGSVLAIAPAIGSVADRLPRRALMVGADLIRAAVALALPFVVLVVPVSLPKQVASEPRGDSVRTRATAESRLFLVGPQLRTLSALDRCLSAASTRSHRSDLEALG